jgi:hypothetical protein
MLMSNPWFRLYSEFATDPIVQSLAFEDQRHFIVVLCLKCDEILDRKIAQTIKDKIIFKTLGLTETAANEAKKRLMEVGLIDKNWQPRAWDRRQYVSDISTGRVRKYRKNNKTGNVTETFPNRFGNAPEAEAEADTETDTNSGDRERSSVTVRGEKQRDDFQDRHPHKTPLPREFEEGKIPGTVKAWAAGKGINNLDLHLESFVLKAKARGYEYANWDAALITAIRDNWAGIENHAKPYTDKSGRFDSTRYLADEFAKAVYAEEVDRRLVFPAESDLCESVGQDLPKH